MNENDFPRLEAKLGSQQRMNGGGRQTREAFAKLLFSRLIPPRQEFVLGTKKSESKRKRNALP
jgi:hypothetical protein